MKKNTIILTAAALLVLAGCNKGLDNSPRVITIQAGIGTMTKVSYNGDKASFVSGDKISVYAWTGSATAVPASLVVDGVVNTYDGSKWTPASQMLWDDKSSKHYFLGISPERSVTDFTADAYTLNPADFAASDLLIATNVAGLEPSLTPVELGFSHALARLDVNLTFRSQWDVAPSVTSVKATAKKTATVDYLAKALTATGTAEAVALTASNNASWSGLQVPQTGVTTITITIDGKDYVFTNASGIPLVGGKYTTVNLAVGRDKIELSDAITISDWTSQGAALEGDALEPDPYNGHAYVDMGNGLKWATCNVGATNPEDYGDYFDWGATVPYYQAGYSQESPCTHWIDGKDGYDWKNYSFMEDGQSSWERITKYTFADNQKDGTWWYDGDTFKGDNGDGVEHKDFASYDYADDAARQNWGGNWRTPTDAEWTWLRENCNWVWTTDYNSTGMNGMLVTSKVAGYETSSIFLPTTGYRDNADLYSAGSLGIYWSSSLNETRTRHAWGMTFNSVGADRSYDGRFFGQSVRPVIN